LGFEDITFVHDTVPLTLPSPHRGEGTLSPLPCGEIERSEMHSRIKVRGKMIVNFSSNSHPFVQYNR
jgi:hypothetical protein